MALNERLTELSRMKAEGSLTDQQFATLVELAKDDERKSNANFAQMKDDGLLSDQEVATPGESAIKQESKSSKLNERAQMKESTVSVEEELKWMTKRYSWRYIPFRYQAMVATIVSAFLYYNIFELFFNVVNGSTRACGTLLRPVIDGEGDSSYLGWLWDSPAKRNTPPPLASPISARLWRPTTPAAPVWP